MTNKATNTLSHIFYPSMKLADMIDINYRLLNVFARLGIKLGFGETTAEQICKKHGISVTSFMTICNIYSFEDYFPNNSTLEKNDVFDILTYLKSSHSFYNDIVIPRIQEKLSVMIQQCEVVHKNILNKFFDGYCREIHKHFEYEDKIVFPYVEGLLAKGSKMGYNIEEFEHNHSDIDGKLNDLKNIIVKYLPGNIASNMRIELLFEVFLLEEDLNKHTLIENKVLIPVVAKIEKG